MRSVLRIPTAAAVAVLLVASRVSADDFDAVREEFLANVNAARTAQGIVPLVLSDRLSRVAQRLADEVGRSAEPDPETVSPEDVVRRAEKAGYSPRALAEVFTRADGSIPEVVGFLRESGGSSWRNLLGGTFRDLGVGVSIVDDVPLYVLVIGQSWEEHTAERSAAYRDLPAMRRQMLALVNLERRNRNLPHLRSSVILDRIAQEYADDMLRRSYYGHESPEGQTVRERALAGGYRLTAVGENIASGQPTVEEVMTGWMRSPEHRANVLSPVFLEVGFGLAIGKNRSGFQLIWVQVFGRPRQRFG